MVEPRSRGWCWAWRCRSWCSLSSAGELESRDADNDRVFLVIGPWHHGQAIGDGSTLGPLRFHGDRFALPTANHVFLPGHRLMVQVQSSWFPLYDRNPQTFVSSIFFAKPADFRKAVQRVHHAPGRESYVELPMVTTRESASSEQ